MGVGGCGTGGVAAPRWRSGAGAWQRVLATSRRRQRRYPWVLVLVLVQLLVVVLVGQSVVVMRLEMLVGVCGVGVGGGAWLEVMVDCGLGQRLMAVIWLFGRRWLIDGQKWLESQVVRAHN